MNILKTLLYIISIFIFFFLESFFMKVFGFSLFVILTINMWQRVKDIWFFTYISFFGILLDVMLHTAVGMHMSVIAILILLLQLLYLFIPKESNYKYINVFIFIFLYYILSLTMNSLLKESVFPSIESKYLLHTVLKGILSMGICILVDKILLSMRNSKGGGGIRLK